MAPNRPHLRARKIPNVGKAWIPEQKLKEYVLNPDHLRGRHKARLFHSVLGIDQGEWRYLHDQILALLPAHPVDHARIAAPYGIEYVVHLPIDGLNSTRAVVITSWMFDAERKPRLTSAYLDIP